MPADLPATRRYPPARPAAALPAAATDGTRRGRHATKDRAAAWLRNAMIALAVLAATAAAVSWDAQYVLVKAVKHTPAIAALEAGIPDVGALIFAALGIALALHGKRAIRARTLNVACVGISLAMNALASAPGWRDLAIWIMPSAVYALASDTLIGVIRAWAIARGQARHETLADDEPTPMAIIGGLLLWLLRLCLAPPSTIAGFRRWALDECPIAPGRKALHPDATTGHFGERGARSDRRSPIRRAIKPGKQARMITLADQRHDLAALPLKEVSGIANQIGAEVDLSPGTARRVLLRWDCSPPPPGRSRPHVSLHQREASLPPRWPAPAATPDAHAQTKARSVREPGRCRRKDRGRARSCWCRICGLPPCRSASAENR